MWSGILAGISKAGLTLIATLLTEALFKQTLARLMVFAIEWMVKSTKTEVDDSVAEPFIKLLKKEY